MSGWAELPLTRDSNRLIAATREGQASARSEQLCILRLSETASRLAHQLFCYVVGADQSEGTDAMPRILKVIAFCAGISVLGYGVTPWMAAHYGAWGVEEKLAAAFPIPSDIQARLDGLQRYDDPEGVKYAQQQVSSRLHYRLVKCSPTYTPRWYESLETVQQRVDNPACFAQQNERLAQLAGLLEVGLVLRQPPLRPAPTQPSVKVKADSTIHFEHYATNAGVAMLGQHSQVQLVDMGTGEVLLSVPLSNFRAIRNLSANGRLFTDQGDTGETLIREVAGGRTVVKLPVQQGCSFIWLDVRTSACMNGQYLSFVDYRRGQVVQTDLHALPYLQAASVPDKPDHYVLLSPQRVVEVQLVQRDGTPRAQLVRELDTETLTARWDSDALIRSKLNADGSRYLMATEAGQLIEFSLRNFQTRALDTRPLFVRRVVPTAAPSKVLFYGGFKPGGGFVSNGFVLDLERQQMAPVTAGHNYEDFAGSLLGMSVVRNNTLTLIKDLPVGEPVALAQWRTQMEAEAARRD